MTPTHLANLTKLADWLEEHKLAARFLDVGIFDMALYEADNDEYLLELYRFLQDSMRDPLPLALEDCQTAACALGWATVAIEPKWADESFADFAERLFGVRDHRAGAGQFLFAYGWTRHPDTNTVDAAIERIRAVVELQGRTPVVWPHWDHATGTPTHSSA